MNVHCINKLKQNCITQMTPSISFSSLENDIVPSLQQVKVQVVVLLEKG